jgi:hypothetical protein
MRAPDRYNGDAVVRILKDGRVKVTYSKTIEYPSIEAAGIHISNAEVCNALVKPMPPIIDFPIKKIS